MAAGQAAGGRRRGVFEVDEDAALVELEQAWADGGYHGFCVLEHSLWSAITSSGEVLTGNTPDGLDQQIRAHWQALQRAGRQARWRAGETPPLGARCCGPRSSRSRGKAPEGSRDARTCPARPHGPARRYLSALRDDGPFCG